jgi:glycosyltransferase involved in cell wall biosynthesis
MIVSGSVPPEPCGVGDHAARLARELSGRNGIDVAVLTSSWIKAPERQGRTQFFPVVRDGGRASLMAALGCMGEWRPDVVHYQYPTQGYARWGPSVGLLPALAWWRGHRPVFTWHEPVRIRPHSLLNIMLPGGLVLVRPNYRELMGFWFRGLHRIKYITYVTNGSTFPKSSQSEVARSKLRSQLMGEKRRLVLYFGFASAQKGVEQVFQIADPGRDRLLLCFVQDPRDPYHAKIAHLAGSGDWRSNARLLGFLPERQIADLLHAADAVVLPFRAGSGPWNTSTHAVREQGTLLITTSREQRGYVANENTFYAAPGDADAMRAGLAEHIGKRGAPSQDSAKIWERLADDHVALYRQVITTYLPRRGERAMAG